MGFRKDAYATVWSVETVSDTYTKGRVSISHKNKQTGEYETDFSGFVGFVGSAAARKAAALKEKDRIKLGDVDVTNKYDKEKNVTYTNFKIFSFDTQESGGTGGESRTVETAAEQDGASDDPSDDLPF